MAAYQTLWKRSYDGPAGNGVTSRRIISIAHRPDESAQLRVQLVDGPTMGAFHPLAHGPVGHEAHRSPLDEERLAGRLPALGGQPADHRGGVGRVPDVEHRLVLGRLDDL